jgi:hypothetical protein
MNAAHPDEESPERLATVVVLALIAAHVALLGFAIRGRLSLAVVVGVLVLKYVNRECTGVEHINEPPRCDQK